ncbi:MAG: hypothetical protein ABUL68_05565, partial [Pseudomonadota bacterium]
FGVTLVDKGLVAKARDAGEGVSFAGRRGLAAQIEWVTRQPPDLGGVTELSDGDMERTRIRAGIPAIPDDIGPGDLPNEGGLESEAISYTKGCYLGQEVMARLKSMGQVRRQLLRVTGHGRSPARRARLFQGERPVGEIRTLAAEGEGYVGLALLTLMHLQQDLPLSLAPDAPPTIKLGTSA